MTTDEFRRHGHAMVDWVADFMAGVGDLPVQSTVEPGDLRAMLPESAPEEPESFETIAADLDRIVVPGLTNWQAPGWFAFFPGNASGPGTLAELVAAGLGQQGMMWATSPICTELETAMMDWMVDLLGLPPTWKTTSTGGGVIQPTASDGTHTALVVTRDRAQRGGAHIGDVVAYVSSQAHSSVEKGARVAGYQHIRLLEVDEKLAVDVEAFEALVAEDRANDLVPTFICSAVGTTGTTAVDPVRAIGEISRREGMWHHVDAAYAGNAMICDEFRHHQDGLELADSYLVNPYKWMGVNFDGSYFFVADRAPFDSGPFNTASLPAQQGLRGGRGDRLPGLARSVGSTVSFAQALVCVAPLRRIRDSPSHKGACTAGTGAGIQDRGGPPIRGGGSGAFSLWSASIM